MSIEIVLCSRNDPFEIFDRNSDELLRPTDIFICLRPVSRVNYWFGNAHGLEHSGCDKKMKGNVSRWKEAHGNKQRWMNKAQAHFPKTNKTDDETKAKDERQASTFQLAIQCSWLCHLPMIFIMGFGVVVDIGRVNSENVMQIASKECLRIGTIWPSVITYGVAITFKCCVCSPDCIRARIWRQKVSQSAVGGVLAGAGCEWWNGLNWSLISLLRQCLCQSNNTTPTNGNETEWMSMRYDFFCCCLLNEPQYLLKFCIQKSRVMPRHHSYANVMACRVFHSCRHSNWWLRYQAFHQASYSWASTMLPSLSFRSIPFHRPAHRHCNTNGRT